jgi:arabinan endo-1,5-alpha-L-arabinosidase
LRVHDPSRILWDGGRYYLFHTDDGVGTKSSEDLFRWVEGPPVFKAPPAWAQEVVPGFRGKMWAPDVVRVGDQFFLYYSVSRFGKQTSAIGLATNATLNAADAKFKWVDQGVVIQSREGSPYNAIDPAAFLDDDGKLWLAFGSFWGGIYVTELDPATGKQLAPETPPTHVASNKASATDIEAACIHKQSGHYYLFVNWGRCCAGVRSTYNVRVGRGDRPAGPFVDKQGVDLAKGGGSMFLETSGKFIGPGHIGVLVDGAVGDDGSAERVSYHYYDSEDRGRSKLAIRRLSWSADGWPTAAAGD